MRTFPVRFSTDMEECNFSSGADFCLEGARRSVWMNDVVEQVGGRKTVRKVENRE